MIDIQQNLKPGDLLPAIERMWEYSAAKIGAIEREYDAAAGAPVFTVEGRYTTRGWTEWTQGFQFGSAILQYDATGEERFLESGRNSTVRLMAPHITHYGVHDHGFNNVSTYGNLLRLMHEGRIEHDPWQKHFYELALKCSGAVQAMRWTPIAGGGGFIYSFNGPHSLFADTIRSLRALALSHRLGHVLQGENDVVISLMDRLKAHARATKRYVVYFGEGRDIYDIRGRVAHEALFNPNDGNFRAPSTQQGYAPFSTWTRALAWVICGYAEQLEFFDSLGGGDRDPMFASEMLETARAAADFYIEHTPVCGVPYWDTGAPGLEKMGDYLGRPADPFNEYEPVDSSAAAITAQGLLRLGTYLRRKDDADAAERYFQAGLSVLDTLLDEPYLSSNPRHQGLLLHSVYHRPNGWDHVPGDGSVPSGEATMWGDYHLRETALYVQRLAKNEPYLTFFGGV